MINGLKEIQLEEIHENGLSEKDLESLAIMLSAYYDEMSIEKFREMEYGIS